MIAAGASLDGLGDQMVVGFGAGLVLACETHGQPEHGVPFLWVGSLSGG